MGNWKTMLPSMPIMGAVPSLDDKHYTAWPYLDAFVPRIALKTINSQTRSLAEIGDLQKRKTCGHSTAVLPPVRCSNGTHLRSGGDRRAN